MQILQIIKIPGLILHLAHIKSGREFTYQYNCVCLRRYIEINLVPLCKNTNTIVYLRFAMSSYSYWFSKLEMTLQH